MLRQSVESYSPETTQRSHRARREPSLHIVLWSLWSLAVVGTAFWHWQSDIAAQQPVDMLGLVIYSVLTGLIGLLVLTLIELWLEPLRFID